MYDSNHESIPKVLRAITKTSVDLHFAAALARLHLVVLLEPQFQLPWKAVVALLADGLQVDLVELGLFLEQAVARGARKVVRAPGLIQGVHHVSLDDLRFTCILTSPLHRELGNLQE